METVGDAAVVTFTEFITEIWVGDGIAEACQILPAVACDIAVVECNDLAVVSGKHIAEGCPTASSLALQANIEVVIDQELEDGLDAGSVIPDETNPLWEYGKELLSQAKFQGRGPVQRDDDFIEVRHSLKSLHDCLQCRASQFCVERGEDQGDGIDAPITRQLSLQLVHVRLAEAVQHRDNTVLVEV